MHLFKKQVNTKNYLRAYCNIGRSEFTDQGKSNLVVTLKDIALQLLKFEEVKFDIYGDGYGISKSSQLLGEKGFKSRLDKIGYSKLSGISILSEKKYTVGFGKLKTRDNVPYLNLYFSWPILLNNNFDLVKSILSKLEECVEIDYAYSYPAPAELIELDEGKLTRGCLSLKSNLPKDESDWFQFVQSIKTGRIKKIYPVNYFNANQLAKLSEFKSELTHKMRRGNEIWFFNESKLKRLNLFF